MSNKEVKAIYVPSEVDVELGVDGDLRTKWNDNPPRKMSVGLAQYAYRVSEMKRMDSPPPKILAN